MKKIDTIVEIQKTLFEIEKLLHKVSFFWDQSQDGFPPKKGPLIGWPVYQLEACLLTVNHLNSCSDSDLRKNWLALMPPIMILGHNCDVIFRMDVWVLVVRFHLMSNVFLVIGVISSNEFLSSSQRYVLKNQKRSTYIFNFSGEEQFFIFWLEKPQQKNFTRCVAKIKGRTFGGDISCCNTHRGLNNDKK